MSEKQRGLPARVGISLLNLLAPGLGLLRTGEWRRAASLYLIAVAGMVVLIVGFSTTQTISFEAYASLVGIVIATSLATYVLAIWWTWRQSVTIIEPRPIWSRWYSIIAALLLAFGLSWILTGILQGLYRNFYLPSEAMEPTLNKADRLVAAMSRPEDLRRGDILLVRTADGSIYIERLAALPGDTIGLRNGIVWLNGKPVPLEPVGRRTVSYGYMPSATATILREHFPGEVGTHLIQDLGRSQVDDFSEVTVAPGHLFVLGDSRDNSADSRVPEVVGGLEQVPLDHVVGRALFTYWPLRKIGQSLRGAR